MGSCIQGQGRSERKTPPVARPWRSRPSFWERDLEVRQQKKRKKPDGRIDMKRKRLGARGLCRREKRWKMADVTFPDRDDGAVSIRQPRLGGGPDLVAAGQSALLS